MKFFAISLLVVIASSVSGEAPLLDARDKLRIPIEIRTHNFIDGPSIKQEAKLIDASRVPFDTYGPPEKDLIVEKPFLPSKTEFVFKEPTIFLPPGLPDLPPAPIIPDVPVRVEEGPYPAPVPEVTKEIIPDRPVIFLPPGLPELPPAPIIPVDIPSRVEERPYPSSVPEKEYKVPERPTIFLPPGLPELPPAPIIPDIPIRVEETPYPPPMPAEEYGVPEVSKEVIPERPTIFLPPGLPELPPAPIIPDDIPSRVEEGPYPSSIPEKEYKVPERPTIFLPPGLPELPPAPIIPDIPIRVEEAPYPPPMPAEEYGVPEVIKEIIPERPTIFLPPGLPELPPAPIIPDIPIRVEETPYPASIPEKEYKVPELPTIFLPPGLPELPPAPIIPDIPSRVEEGPYPAPIPAKEYGVPEVTKEIIPEGPTIFLPPGLPELPPSPIIPDIPIRVEEAPYPPPMPAKEYGPPIKDVIIKDEPKVILPVIIAPVKIVEETRPRIDIINIVPAGHKIVIPEPIEVIVATPPKPIATVISQESKIYIPPAKKMPAIFTPTSKPIFEKVISAPYPPPLPYSKYGKHL